MKTNQYDIEAKPRFEVLDGLRGVAAVLPMLRDFPGGLWPRIAVRGQADGNGMYNERKVSCLNG